MKIVKHLLMILALSGMITSCVDDDENYTAGFVISKPNPNGPLSGYYANNVGDSLVFFSYGKWYLEDYPGYDNSWISVQEKSGYGGVISSQYIAFEQNTTGKGRLACIRLNDKNHSDKANYAVAFWQCATRGDGSLGNAPDVKTVTGTDGSAINAEYDDLHRPTKLNITKDNSTLANLSIVYDDASETMTVTDKSTTLSASYDQGYQPESRLIGGTDTIGYYSLTYSNGFPISMNYAFKVEHRAASSVSTVAYTFPSNGVSLAADSLHNADTLYYFKDGERLRKLGLNYSSQDNRCQSLDVNQLLLGVEECNPYLLLSVFRYARNTSIISKASNDSEEIVVTTQLNADKSVREMTVRKGDETVTYTFTY